MFTTKYEDYSDPNSATGQSYSSGGFGYMKPEPGHNMKIEDEEDLLYGESGSSFKMKNVRTEFNLRTISNKFLTIFYYSS